jgi:thioredoxin-like negative regulator of GroEL
MDDQDYFGPKNPVRELSPSDFEDVVTHRLRDKKCGLIMFYAPWCPHCKMLKDIWEEFARLNAYYFVAALNCEKHRILLDKMKAELPGLIQVFPTLILYDEGEPKEVYSGERTVDALAQFALHACKK